MELGVANTWLPDQRRVARHHDVSWHAAVSRSQRKRLREVATRVGHNAAGRRVVVEQCHGIERPAVFESTHFLELKLSKLNHFLTYVSN